MSVRIFMRPGTIMACLLLACGLNCMPSAHDAAHGPTKRLRPPGPVITRTVQVALPSGTTDVDLYLSQGTELRPLVVVAHGFSRSKTNMANWGRKLAEEGMIAAVPDLPGWADHGRNGRFINELIEHLIALPPEDMKVEKDRIGLMGFSAGGLATLLAAADNPAVKVWVGLDPVDRNGMGKAVAGKLRCRVAILRAEPSASNAYGNAAGIEAALKVPCLRVLVPQATHADPEWPTDWKAELVCGKSSEQRRGVFVKHATQTLTSELMPGDGQ